MILQLDAPIYFISRHLQYSFIKALALQIHVSHCMDADILFPINPKEKTEKYKMQNGKKLRKS